MNLDVSEGLVIVFIGRIVLESLNGWMILLARIVRQGVTGKEMSRQVCDHCIPPDDRDYKHY